MSEAFKNTRTAFETGSGSAYLYSLEKLKEMGYGNIDKLPFSIKILLEAVLREFDGYAITETDIEALANYDAKARKAKSHSNLRVWCFRILRAFRLLLIWTRFVLR